MAFIEALLTHDVETAAKKRNQTAAAAGMGAAAAAAAGMGMAPVEVEVVGAEVSCHGWLSVCFADCDEVS